MRVLPFILVCLLAQSIVAQPDSGGTVRVHVVNSVTRAPVISANVVLSGDQGDQVSGRTDTAGLFAARTKHPGHVFLAVTRRGYRMTGQGMGQMVEVRTGAENEVSVEMLPLGVIAGRVLDQYGDPVWHALVRTEDERSAQGFDQYYESYSVAVTDDRGEYRIAEVEPGKHYVAVEYSTTHNQLSSGTRSRLRWPETAGLVLYPDASDIDKAHQVEVAAGATTRLNDVRLKIQRPVIISGRIQPPPSDPSPSLSLRRTVGLGLGTSAMIQGGESSPDGRFVIRALPGKYVLFASDSKTGKVSKPVAVEVGDKDITGLELDLTLEFRIHGKVVVDGNEEVEFSDLHLELGGGPVQVERGGTFRTNLHERQGYFVLPGLPEGWYVKEVQIAGKRITGSLFEIDPGITSAVITLSPRGATVTIRLEQNAGARDTVYVAMVPESGEFLGPAEFMPHAQTDGSGVFTMPGVPPGSYRVFTFDMTNWPMLMRPQILLAKHRNEAPLVSIAEGEQKTVVIPAQKIRPE